MRHISFTPQGTLIPGVHGLTLSELKNQFGEGSKQRKQLFLRLKEGLLNLKRAGVKNVYLDGSYVTTKAFPNDIDGCWDAHQDIDLGVLDPVFLDFQNRHLMKDKYGVDFFISQIVEGASGVPFVAFFQTDRNDEPKGIILISLEQETFIS